MGAEESQGGGQIIRGWENCIVNGRNAQIPGMKLLW